MLGTRFNDEPGVREETVVTGRRLDGSQMDELPKTGSGVEGHTRGKSCRVTFTGYPGRLCQTRIFGL